MSDTPIYDALRESYSKSYDVKRAQSIIQARVDSVPNPTFQLTEEDVEQLPKIISSSVKTVEIALIDVLPEVREKYSYEEYFAFLSGILTTLDTLLNLGPPQRID